MKCISIFYFIVFLILVYKVDILCIALSGSYFNRAGISAKNPSSREGEVSVNSEKIKEINGIPSVGNNLKNSTMMIGEYSFNLSNGMVNNSELVEVCNLQCEKMSVINGCFCDVGCLQYGDCCELYFPECKNYFTNLDRDMYPLAKVKTEYNEKKGKCCDSFDLPEDCFCDSQCEKNADCCSDYKKCGKVQPGTTLPKTNLTNNANSTESLNVTASNTKKSKKKKGKKDPASNVANPPGNYTTVNATNSPAMNTTHEQLQQIIVQA